MIGIKMLTGKFAGKEKWVKLSDVDPMEFLSAATTHGWHWEVDYSQASEEEIFLWGRADIVCRAVLAKKEGRLVFFDGQEFSDLQEWEDKISSSGNNISIFRDDETGYWVVSVGPEPKKH